MAGPSLPEEQLHDVFPSFKSDPEAAQRWLALPEDDQWQRLHTSNNIRLEPAHKADLSQRLAESSEWAKRILLLFDINPVCSMCLQAGKQQDSRTDMPGHIRLIRFCKTSYMALPAYKLYGSDGSPYSCKVRAALRFLRIAYEWIPVFQVAAHSTHSGELFSKHFPDIKTKVIPVLVRPDGTYANDSTPLLLELQAQHGKTWRSLFPTSAGARFLCALVEDFADEWLTKVMFEGRFHTLEDAKFGAAWQVLQNPLQSKNADTALQAIDMFAARQRERRALVGCSDWTCMEKTLRGVCSALETNLRRGIPFIFGSRPTAADFAIYGQLRQLATDPLPSRILVMA
eukprot:s413_g7.t3